MATSHDFLKVIDSLHSAGVKNLVRLLPREKEPYVLGGHKVTTDSPAVAKSWFTGKDGPRLPNLGVLAGKNNLVFIDVDALEGQSLDPKTVLQALEVHTLCNSTAGGGVHIWFSATERLNPTALRVNLTEKLRNLPGFDKIHIKQGDAYIVIPPSTRKDGKCYRWEIPPWEVSPAEIPAEWLAATEKMLESEDAQERPHELGQAPTGEEFSIVLQAVRSLLPGRALDLIEGRVQTDDRSEQAFELGHLLFESGVTEPRAIATIVYGSEIHRRKFARRRDAWDDACRIAHRVLRAHSGSYAHGTPKQSALAESASAPGPAPRRFEVVTFAELEPQFAHPEFLIYPLLPRGEITLLDGDDGIGKAVALDTLIPTPHGFKKMEDIATGDLVIDGTGQETKVLYTSPVYHNHRCYEVCFDDGSSVIADAEHQWYVQTVQQRTNVQKWRANPKKQAPNKLPSHSVVTTEEMLKTLRAWHGRVLNYSVDIKPFMGRHRDLPIPPYTLGAWLGDGTSVYSEITTADDEILQHIENDGVPIKKQCPNNNGKASKASRYWLGATKHVDGATRSDSLQNKLRKAGLLGNKHIPNEYLFSSFDQRLALLQGIMDTDGCIAKTGVCEFTTTDHRFAKQVRVLLSSLGIKCYYKERVVTGFGKTTTAYRVFFTTTLPVFRLQRKAARLPKKVRPTTQRRYVTEIREVPSVPVKCIAVASPEHTYMCTDNFIITHNTWFWSALSAGLTGSKTCPVPYDHTAPKDARILILTAEDDPLVTLGPRLKTLGADLARISIVKPSGTKFINGITAGELESAKPAIYAVAPDLIVVDHITIYAMSVDGMDTGRDTQVRRMLDSLKTVAKDLNCAVLVIRHFRKGHGSAKDRGLGSVAFRATARSHIVVGFDPEDQTRCRRIITQVKMNLVPKLDEGIAYTITPDDGFAWAGTCSIDPDALTDSAVAAKVAEAATKLDQAKEFLLELLGDGSEVLVEKVVAEAKAHDISKRTLERAAKAIRIQSKRDGFGGPVKWLLPKNSLNVSV